jgi:predicted unusual protein kinase regulating ubiquinone biosynthesis (AarF/ABC1/UbiB family)
LLAGASLMSDEKKIPEGRLGRFARLAGLGARSLVSTNAATAERAAEVLGTLRGLAAKVGQMASYVDGLVPADQQDAYETSLRVLRAAAPRSSSAEIRAVVEQELKAPIDKLFTSWQDEPIASASIGQVHRARLPDGRDVAVKVQHPGIVKAVESDLENAGVIEAIMGSLGGKKLNSKGMLEEMKKRFLEELDYTREADRQWQFSNLHQRDKTIRVPWVIDERSSKRVLTTELATGKTLEEAAAEPEPLRRAYCETLWRFLFKGTLVSGKFNADPHPGNYIFHEEGLVTFLDFGCVQPLEGDRLLHARGMHFAALRRDDAAFAKHASQLLETRGGRYEKLAVAFSRRCFEPLFASPFRLTRAYAANLVNIARGLAREARSMKEGEFVPLPPGMLFMNRLQFGFYSVLARLDVEVDYAAVERAFLEEAGIVDESRR